MQPENVPQKSTTVRPVPLALRMRRWGLQALASVAPSVAEEQVVQAFLTPRHRPAVAPTVPGIEARPFTVRGEAGPIVAWSFGEGPAVLVVHGWESRAADLVAFVAPFVAAGKRVVLFDQPAHGASAGRMTNLFEMARAIKAVTDVTGPLDGLVAHSLGATASSLALVRGLEAKRVVLVAPAVSPDEFVWKLGAALGLDDARIGGALRRIYARLGQERLALDEDVVSLAVPALVVHDRRDREVPFSHGERVAAAWPGARLHPVEGLGHRRIIGDEGIVRLAVSFVAGDARHVEEVLPGVLAS